MRSVELARVALSAEALYLRRVARRQALRGAYAAGAAIFALIVLAVLHVVIYQVARIWLSPLLSSLVVLVLDLIVAGVLGTMALKSVPDSVEVEAQQIRAQALHELKRSLTAMGVAAEVAGLAFRTGARSGVRRSVATIAAEMATRFIGR